VYLKQEDLALYNIISVTEDGLCTGCGTCVGVCPTDALKMHVSNGLLIPQINEDKCTGCGLCVECCPGFAVDFVSLNSLTFGRQPRDFFLGNYLNCYVGHSNDAEIRHNSSSGGIVTQLLIFALEKGVIDGALVIRMRKDKPLEAEPFIARTREEIISASKSKYCPVPINEALRCIIKGEGKFAVVGLPCHIHGIRKAENSIKGLREKIVLSLGIMCSHTIDFFGTELLLEKLGIPHTQIKEIAYRGQGWPGYMLIKLKDNSGIYVPYVGNWNAYWSIFSCFFFTPRRCLMCLDETNEMADISFGDAWMPELKNERNGESIMVARTEKGQEILNLASSAGAIFLKPIKYDKVRQSQIEPLKFKKEDIGVRLTIIKATGQKIPKFNLEHSSYSGSFFSYLRSYYVLCNVWAAEKRSFKKILVYVPFPLFRLYYGIYKYLSKI